MLWALDALTVESTLISATARHRPRSGGGAWGARFHRIGLGPARRRGWGSSRGSGSGSAGRERPWRRTSPRGWTWRCFPAFVTAASVGLYSVATSVVAHRLSAGPTRSPRSCSRLPASDPRRGPRQGRGLLLGGRSASPACLRSGSALLAPTLLALVYGDQFREAAESLRILLPGAVLFAGSSMLERRGVCGGPAVHRHTRAAPRHDRDRGRAVRVPARAVA